MIDLPKSGEELMDDLIEAHREMIAYPPTYETKEWKENFVRFYAELLSRIKRWEEIEMAARVVTKSLEPNEYNMICAPSFEDVRALGEALKPIERANKKP